jgi:hypothetical protein
MTKVMSLNPWSGRLLPGTQVSHAVYGVCTVREAQGLWRTVDALAYEMADEPDEADPLAGERAVPIVRKLSVFELHALDPIADLLPAPAGELVELDAWRARP